MPELLEINVNKELEINAEEVMLANLNKEVSTDFNNSVMEMLLNPEGRMKRRENEQMERENKRKQQPKEIEVSTSLTRKITRCYHECPYFGLDGGPGPAMVCNHPSFNDEPYAGCIISHPDCDDGFPDKCPLLKENKHD